MYTGTTTASSGTIPKFIQKLLRIHRILFFRLIKFILFIILIDSLSLLFPMKEDRLKFQRISSSNFSRRTSIKRKSISIFQRFKKKLLDGEEEKSRGEEERDKGFLSFFLLWRTGKWRPARWKKRSARGRRCFEIRDAHNYARLLSFASRMQPSPPFFWHAPRPPFDRPLCAQSLPFMAYERFLPRLAQLNADFTPSQIQTV